MLQYKVAKKLYEKFQDKIAKASKERLKALYQDFIFSTLVYANTLTVWSQMDTDEQLSYQEKKEEEYLKYAVKLHEICFELGFDDIDGVLIDKEAQSDFACYVQLFISLSHRNKA